METRDVKDTQNNTIGQLTFPDGTPESKWQAALDPYRTPPVTDSSIRVPINAFTTSTVDLTTISSQYCGINYNGAVTINLPSGIDGLSFIIKDESGNAAINNITINPVSTETIEGQSAIVLNINYGSISLLFRNGNWVII